MKTKIDNKNLLDLCRLNQMDENISESSAIDVEETKKLINLKKKCLIEKIKREQGENK